ncbi:hypothetical protein [Rhizobium laguerreae]|uniref:hypothetical protein n=1 Tax=Rhizobium laguerreae TaxID=1076926 RepID=UPI001C92834D|nr:hypothetical protein [Rhizobium laguerreae]MBY3223729.1 hypothetical protein [Rhizobium laguerreae]
MSKKRKKHQVKTPRRSAVYEASKSRRRSALQKLIANLELLVSRSTGLRHYSYKLRLYNAQIALKLFKRSMKERLSSGERTKYVVNPKGFQGGAPGLIHQKRR